MMGIIKSSGTLIPGKPTPERTGAGGKKKGLRDYSTEAQREARKGRVRRERSLRSKDGMAQVSPKYPQIDYTPSYRRGG